MRRWCHVGVLLAVLGALLSRARAQEGTWALFPHQGLNWPVLLRQKAVQEELKLSPEQVKKAAALADKPHEVVPAGQDMGREEVRKRLAELARTNKKSCAEILNPAQLQRLQEIALQQEGVLALHDSEIAAALQLTDTQKETLRNLEEDTRKALRKVVQEHADRREELRQKVAKLVKSSQDRFVQVLSSEQRAKWKDLTGKPFEGRLSLEPWGNRDLGR